ncbi:hypothetical protein [Parabacteroides sp. PF5-9]|uniref:hypothetical protein n=1 Tax=Parabacteroides sp. PF5-9 TaxID=1742404 RepID=UPI00247483FF|nr:hypothetical protein [Parabacteroides sp. PF5-9]MDH6357087.1 hypothetical protein [Parabacteroides sp. PF5-9]
MRSKKNEQKPLRWFWNQPKEGQSIEDCESIAEILQAEYRKQKEANAGLAPA